MALAVSAALVTTAALGARSAPRLLGQGTDLLLRVVSHLPYLGVLAVGGLLLRETLAGGPASAHLPALTLALVVLSGLAILRAVAAQRDAEAEAAARAVQEERLRQGRKLEVMGELAAAVSHDFANLLTAMGGSASDLRERLPDAPEVEELQQLVQRGTELCRGLLKFSRHTAPQGAADLRQVAESVVPLLRRLLPAGHTLTVVGEAGVARAVADPTQVEIALVNLVVNARDAMPRGGAVEITVDAPELPEPARSGPPRSRRWARVTVRDEGVGMDQATLARCVEPFFTTKPAERGTGLGLATVNGIAMGAGGRLEIDSAPGQGTRVSLLLPLA
jgi:signal transduction histidine kinase